MRYLICAAALAVTSWSVHAQDRTIPVPATVTAEGLPPIPQAIADDLARYADYRSATLLAWRPDRRAMIVSTTFGNAQQLHLVDGPGRARTQLTFYRGGVLGQAGFPAYARFDPAHPETFVFRKDVGAGSELMQLFRYDLPTGTITKLTEDTARYGEPVWSHKDGWLAYDATPAAGRDADIWVMQPSNPAHARHVAHLDGAWLVADWSPDDRELLVVELRSEASDTRLWRLRVATGEKVALTPDAESGPAAWTDPRFSRDGRFVYAVSDQGSDRPRLWRIETATGARTALTPEGVDTFAPSPDGSLAAVVFDRGDDSELQVIDLASLVPRRLPAIPLGVISGLIWRPGSLELGFTFSSPRMLADAYSLDVAAGGLTRWTKSEIGGFNPDTLPAPERIRWKSFDGLSMSGVLYRPPARFKGPRPVMINIHGGPEWRSRAVFIGRSNYLVNELGVAIVYPNVRGSVGFGSRFAHLDDGMKREDAVKDIGALLDWIAARPGLDRHRVMVTGASYGGYMTLAATIAYPDRIRCAFEAFGISDFISFLETTDPSRQDDRRQEYGDERDPAMRQFLERISPVSGASSIHVPLFVAHGGNDPRVSADQAARIVEAVRKNGTPLWYVLYKDEGHEMRLRSTNDYNFYCWVMFIKTYLLN